MIHLTDGYEAAAAMPLTHSRILWDNLLVTATFSATSEREGFEADRAQTPDTVSWWWPEVAGSLTATLAAAAGIDGIAIAAHSIGSSGATVTISGHVDGDWVQLHDPISPADDEPIMVAFEAAEVEAVRIALSAPARVGVLYAGAMLEMPQPAYNSLPPLALIRSTTYETNKSQTGQFMGRSISSSSRPFEASWSHLTEAWVRGVFLPFALAARKTPFFIALRPAGYPTDVGYVLTSDDTAPARIGVRDFLQVALKGEAHVGPGT